MLLIIIIIIVVSDYRLLGVTLTKQTLDQQLLTAPENVSYWSCM